MRILGTSLQVTGTVLDDACNMFNLNSGALCHKAATNGILTPRLQIFLECLQLFTLVLRDSG